MKISLLSPYHGGSHQAWAEGYGRYSRHQVEFLTLPARFWKWRMHGGAVTLARRFLDHKHKPDLLLATDMVDLTTFLALTRSRTADLPVVLYMHENQLTYPLPADKSSGPMRRQLGERDQHYAFVNYASMLAADQVWFNSYYHRQSIFDELPRFLKHFPEYNELGTVARLEAKSTVQPVGVYFERLEAARSTQHTGAAHEVPLILWNQRWEYDKNPSDFFRALSILADEGYAFKVILCGQQYGKQPVAFSEWQMSYGDRVAHIGYADSAAYARLLWTADITVSTAHHEFFGISILEAIYAGTFAILPNRLSYPELIPPAHHEACLYQNTDGLLERLRWALSDTARRREIAHELAATTVRFDWRSLAPRYDNELGRLVRSES